MLLLQNVKVSSSSSSSFYCCIVFHCVNVGLGSEEGGKVGTTGTAKTIKKQKTIMLGMEL